jgi:hypothetical protein
MFQNVPEMFQNFPDFIYFQIAVSPRMKRLSQLFPSESVMPATSASASSATSTTRTSSVLRCSATRFNHNTGLIPITGLTLIPVNPQTNFFTNLFSPQMFSNQV